jgi:multisubunit Na+/H+ antiporter MnhE subunit
MKKLVAVWMLMLAGSTFGQQVTGDIVGTVVSLKTKEKLYGAKAIVEDNGKKYQAAADVDGMIFFVFYFQVIKCNANKVRRITSY